MAVSEVATLPSETSGGVTSEPKLLVTLATYNEAGNLRPLVKTIRQFAPNCSILVIDDNSPDGTGGIAEELKAELPEIHIIHRAGKLGLGTATIEAMKFAIDQGYDLLLNLDGDFSHPPRFIPSILAGMASHDVMIGSRYVKGGGVEGEFNLKRKLMSTGINWYARLFLGLSSKDNSGSFRCYRVSKLAQIDFDDVRSRGYSFMEEILYWCRAVGCRIGETPILFENRRAGISKINKKEAVDALRIIFMLGVSRVFGLGKTSGTARLRASRPEIAKMLPPLRFEPILKRHIWGGRRLGTELDKSIGDGDDYAESWEISDHHDDVSIVADGPLAGNSLRELIRTRGKDLLGPALEGTKEFPLLVKFIDAHQNLSVQVHPDDEQSKRMANDNGKTEAWVVLPIQFSEEPAKQGLIYAGLKPGTTREAFSKAIEDGTVADLLHGFTPREFDCVLIPAGTVHAIGAGVLLTEIQQMSDTTFRVFDWNRNGPDGKPRQLHVREALEVIDFDRGPVEPWKSEEKPVEGGGTRKRLASCPYFALERLSMGPRGSGTLSVGRPERDRFTILIVLQGYVELESPFGKLQLQFGQTVLLPASLGACTVRSLGKPPGFELLTCIVP